MRLLSLLLIYLFSTGSLCAQRFVPRYSSNGISGRKSHERRKVQPINIQLKGGLTQFFGEVNEQAMPVVTGVSLGYSFNKVFSLTTDFTAGKLGGQENSFFHSYFITEYNTVELLAKWDLTEHFSYYEPGPAHAFIYGGIGQVYFNANAFDLNTDTLQRFSNSRLSARNPLFVRWGPPKGPPGIRKTREGIAILGTCVEYALLSNMKLGIDYRFYFVRTDKLDATSGRRHINPEEAESYSDTPDDKFSFLSAFISFSFGSKKRKAAPQ